MNILFISNEYPPETGSGGIGTYTKHSAEGLCRLGHTVHVICRSPSATPVTTIIHGVIIHRIGPGTYPLPGHRIFYPFRSWCYRRIPHSLQRIAWAREAYATYMHVLRPSIRFDIIEYPECGNEGYFFSKLRDIPRIVRLHTPWETVRKLDYIKESVFDRIILSYCERSTVKRSTAVTCPSQSLALEIENRWNVKTAKVFPNPLPVSDFNSADGHDWIYTGRIEFRKGVHVLIQAYAQVAQSLKPPYLYIIGKPYGRHLDGSDYGDYIRRLIAQQYCRDRITWIPGLPYSEIPNRLRQCAVAVFPSLWENLPYSCMEALASGLTVVASATGGFTELIDDGVNGLLFEPGNVEQLTLQLLKLSAQPRLQRELGAQARLRALRSFDSGVVCKLQESFYRTIKEGAEGC